jgi:hypothetical protein
MKDLYKTWTKGKDEMKRDVTRQPDDVVLEVTTQEGEIRRFIVPYKEWMIIKEWYCDPSLTSDYYLVSNNPQEPYTISRLDKKVSEIKAWSMTPSSTVSKSIASILVSAVPGGIRFFVAFFISLAIWGLFGLILLIKGSEVNIEMLSPAMKITSIIFGVFLLLNLLCMVLNIIDILKNKYRALLYENDTPVTYTFIFNFILLAFFTFNNPVSIFNLIKKIWSSI